ncbi:hypothetical protein [Natrinema sp. H-ect4]|uniref:hypothetical protein n=1 Tax=Natrinema sp. H-ect4 TaxID=3242699 RepID=UPI0035A85B3C
MIPVFHQYGGNSLLTRFLNVFNGPGVSDAHSGFRIVTQEAYKTMELDPTGMEFSSEMIMAAGASGLEIVEMQIVYHEHEGEGALESFKNGWRHVKFMLVKAPSYLFSVPELLMGLIGLAMMEIAYSNMSVNVETTAPIR